jgi:2-aminoethylphosphonate-pyruvate transaminase
MTPRPGIETAVILAAGRGVRLGEAGQQAPKGFLRLGERPIIEESLERLRAVGIRRVVIVTGHLAEHYERLARRLDGGAVETVHNPLYASSGSMYSLFQARDHVREPFLLLESDLVYERRALERLLAVEARDAVLVSGPTGAGDEVYVEGRGGWLTGMSKDRSRLAGEIVGELVGISRLSPRLLDAMTVWAEQAFRRTLAVDYETDALVAAAQEVPVRCVRVDDLAWGEIDDLAHLRRAREVVYPAILARDR